MRVHVFFFGLAHDATGLKEDTAEISEGETLDTLRQRYQERFPALRAMAESVLLSVNQSVEESSRILQDGDEVAFLPPVSGGANDDMYHIARKAISGAELADRLKLPEYGAVVVFEGTVRNHSHDRRTLYLEYEAYEAMAIRALREIGEETRSKFPVGRIGVIHRVGRIEIGETSVAIAVTSAHRAAAFGACRFLIDELKRRVPIWKKEYFADGAAWAEGASLRPACEPV